MFKTRCSRSLTNLTGLLASFDSQYTVSNWQASNWFAALLTEVAKLGNSVLLSYPPVWSPQTCPFRIIGFRGFAITSGFAWCVKHTRVAALTTEKGILFLLCVPLPPIKSPQTGFAGFKLMCCSTYKGDRVRQLCAALLSPGLIPTKLARFLRGSITI